VLGKFKLQLFDILLIAALFTFCTATQADPFLIGGIAISWMTVAQVVVIAYSVYGASQQRKASKAAAAKARSDYNAGLQDRTVTNVATDSPHRIIYGEARVGSSVVAMFSSGDKDQYKHLVCIHAAHECESIGEIYVAGEALGALDANGDVTSGKYFSGRTEDKSDSVTSQVFTLSHTPVSTVTVGVMSVDENGTGYFSPFPATVSGSTISVDNGTWASLAGKQVIASYQYSVGTSRIRVKKHLGTPTDPADASLIAELPDKWPSTSTLRGMCYTVVRLDLNQPEFQSGVPTIEPIIKGKRLYDPRDGVTRWSDNPALATYDYLTSDICGVPASDLPVAQYITAANVCDEWCSFGNRYTINGTVSSEQSQSQVLESMAQCMGGAIVSTTWDIYAGKYVAPVMALSQTDIVGNIAITPGISDADLYNGVKGQYIGAENLWVSTDYKPYQNATYAATDGRDLWNSLDMPFTNTVQRVHNLCRIFVEDQRNGFTLKADFSLKAWGLKVGQRVTFTSAFFGQTAKVYRVTDKKFSPSSAIELTLKEDSSTIWDFADAVVADDTPNTNLPNPWVIADIAALTCASGTNVLLMQSDGTIVSRILATWPVATTHSVVDSGYVEVQYQAIGNTEWATLQFGGGDTKGYLLGVVDGSYYNVRIRAVNTTLNVKSDWTYAAVHLVFGKTAPPSDITTFTSTRVAGGFTLSWTKIADVDADLYEIREGGNSWDNGNVVCSTRSDTFYYKVTEARDYVLRIKARDTTGNLSVSPLLITATKPPPPDTPWFSVEGNTFTWGPVADVDLAGYSIRYHYGHNESWGDASPLHDGILTRSPYTPDALPQGQLTLMLRSIDVQGNLSSIASVIQTKLGDVLVANVVETFDFKAAGYTGTLTNCTVTGGVLLATTVSDFYGDDTANFYSAINTSTFYNDYYSGMVYETNIVTPTLASVGSNMTLNFTTVGDALEILYRVSGGNPLYNVVGAEDFYGLDTSLFYGQSPDYQVWPGQITAGNLQYQFKFILGQGTTQGTVDVCNALIDVPDKVVRVSGFVISSSGSRLPLSSTFSFISNVQLTLEADGGTAASVVIVDKNPTLGPLICCKDSTGTLVAGLVDAVIQGY